MVDGEGVDQHDGNEPKSEFQSARMDVDNAKKGQGNECPRCKREFNCNEQEELHAHIDRCMDT